MSPGQSSEQAGGTPAARAEATIGRFKQVIGTGEAGTRFRVRNTWNAADGLLVIHEDEGRLVLESVDDAVRRA